MRRRLLFSIDLMWSTLLLDIQMHKNLSTKNRMAFAGYVKRSLAKLML